MSPKPHTKTYTQLENGKAIDPVSLQSNLNSFTPKLHTKTCSQLENAKVIDPVSLQSNSMQKTLNPIFTTFQNITKDTNFSSTIYNDLNNAIKVAISSNNAPSNANMITNTVSEETKHNAQNQSEFTEPYVYKTMECEEYEEYEELCTNEFMSDHNIDSASEFEDYSQVDIISIM